MGSPREKPNFWDEFLVLFRLIGNVLSLQRTAQFRRQGCGSHLSILPAHAGYLLRPFSHQRELYFTDPDGILLQIQDMTYCGGSGKLGEVCAPG